jgi:hypothetical protein
MQKERLPFLLIKNIPVTQLIMWRKAHFKLDGAIYLESFSESKMVCLNGLNGLIDLNGLNGL